MSDIAPVNFAEAGLTPAAGNDETGPVNFAEAGLTPMPEGGAPEAGEPIRISPADQARFAEDDKYSPQFAAGRPAFKQLGQTPTQDDVAYARWLDRTGKLTDPNAPGVLSQVKDFGASIEAGAVNTFSHWLHHGVFGSGDLLSDHPGDAANSAEHDRAVSVDTVNKIRANGLGLFYGATHLADKGFSKVASALANLRDDPAFAAKVKASNDYEWYTFHQRIGSLAADQQRVSDAAANIAIHAGTPASELNDSSNFGSVAADPSQYVVGVASDAAITMTKGVISAALRKPIQLGIEDGLRTEVAAAAANATRLRQLANEVSALPAHEHEFTVLLKSSKEADAALAQKQAALNAVSSANKQVLQAAGRPNIAARAVVGAGTSAASAIEKAGTWLASKNQGIVDSVLSTIDAADAKSVVNFVRRNPPTRVAGALVGGAVGYEEGGDWKSAVAGGVSGAAIGEAAPAALSYAGRLSRILGENYLIGRATVPYFARLSTDAEANGMEKFVFRQLDKFTPAVDFARNIGSAAAKGAAAGAALGYVGSGGESSDLAVNAGLGAALHFTPWAMVSNLHGFWSPVRSAGEFANMRAANLRALQERWAGSDNLVRLNSLSSNQQLDVAHLAVANPDFTLRLIGKDDNVIAADQLAQGAAPADYSKTPGFHYKDPVTGRSVVVLNPGHPDAMAPVLAHEFWHKAQSEGMAGSIVTELVGDSKLGLPGMFTRLDPDTGKPVTRADGSFETTPDFAAAKAEYERRLSARGVQATLTDAEFALEHAAEQGADFALGGQFDDVMRPTIGSLMLSVLPDSIRDALGAAGRPLGTDAGTEVRGSMGLGLSPSPAVEKLMKAYAEQWRVGRNVSAPVDATAKTVELSREAILKNPDILKVFSGSSALNVDAKTGQIAGTKIGPDGKLVIVDPEKVFKSTAQIAKEQSELAAHVVEAVKAATDVATDKDAVKVTAEKGREVASGRYLSDETLKYLEQSGRFNPFQLEAIKNLNALMKAGTGDYVRFFYQPATKGGKYQSLRGHWREEVPYSWYISQADNILFRTVSLDKVVRNLERLWDREPTRAQSLWASKPSMMQDAVRYLRNLSNGDPGETNLTTAKRDFINLALGLNVGDRARINPLYDETTVQRLESFITSRRIDRTSRIVPPERNDRLPWSYKAYLQGAMNYTAGRPTETDRPLAPERGEPVTAPTEGSDDHGKARTVGNGPSAETQMTGGQDAQTVLPGGPQTPSAPADEPAKTPSA